VLGVLGVWVLLRLIVPSVFPRRKVCLVDAYESPPFA
jgi:hypothetical protein